MPRQNQPHVSLDRQQDPLPSSHVYHRPLMPKTPRTQGRRAGNRQDADGGNDRPELRFELVQGRRPPHRSNRGTQRDPDQGIDRPWIYNKRRFGSTIRKLIYHVIPANWELFSSLTLKLLFEGYNGFCNWFWC